MKTIWLLDWWLAGTVAIFAEQRNAHTISYIAGALMLFCWWMYNRTRLR